MAPSINRIWSWMTRSGEKEEKESFYIENGAELIKGLAASCEGKHHLFRNFTAEEINSMTNNFREQMEDLGYYGHIFKGCFENQKVTIHIYSNVNNIVLTSRVSHHKNILKLLGYCLEFSEPVLVYEYLGGDKLLCDLIYDPKKSQRLKWKSILRIARDIAGVLVYLHTAFSTPIIYRGLNPDHIVIGGSGVAKLFDFSLCMPLPPGKFEVVDSIRWPYGFADPDYIRSGIVTTKSDVFNFGVLLFVLLTGQEIIDDKGRLGELVADVMNECVGEDSKLKKIVDSMLFKHGIGNAEEYGQLQAFLELAERCILKKREDRPEVLDVAKELKRIERLASYTA